jgi:hypothetical protein
MPYTSFHTYCPEIAEKETRSITIFPDKNYIDGIKQHYRLFRQVLNHKGK